MKGQPFGQECKMPHAAPKSDVRGATIDDRLRLLLANSVPRELPHLCHAIPHSAKGIYINPRYL